MLPPLDTDDWPAGAGHERSLATVGFGVRCHASLAESAPGLVSPIEYSAHMRALRFLPVMLTVLRAVLAPIMVLLAVAWPCRAAFGVCLVIAFLSDVFDGVIARRLGTATPNLRRLDSIADSLFYVGALFAAWHLQPQALLEHRTALILLMLLEITRYAFDLRKFGREASYHMWSSKLWGLALFVGFFSLLALGHSGWAVAAAVWLGIVADVEGLAISAVLTRWKNDVPSIVHAHRLRRSGLA